MSRLGWPLGLGCWACYCAYLVRFELFVEDLEPNNTTKRVVAWALSVLMGLCSSFIAGHSVHSALRQTAEWQQCGPLLRARMAAAVRVPDAEVLALLTDIGQTKFGEKQRLDENTTRKKSFRAWKQARAEPRAPGALWSWRDLLVSSW